MENQLVKKQRSPAVRAAFPLYLLVATSYLTWRITTTYSWGEWYFWLLIACESLSVALTLLYLGTARTLAVPVFTQRRPHFTVDIFIPTYNEPEEVVKLTLIGALHVRGRRKVFLLDDGRRLNMRAMAEALGAEYVSRQDNNHAKAGNMNAGIQRSDSDLMLFLDCDHVPQPNIIERMLPYFRDSKLAFVQSPQLFYNTTSVQFRPTKDRPLWNEQCMFYESIQLSKNCFNAAFFCGSGAMLRRAAIDSIGGFATGTATEDIHTSLKLHAQGWRSLYINEQLAHGIAPVNMVEYHKQRMRWGAGSLGLLVRSPDSPLRAKGLTMAQRICYFNSTFSFTFGLQRIFYMLFPALLVLLSPVLLDDQYVDVPYYLGIMCAFIAFSYWCTWVTSDGTYHPIYTEQYNLANMFSHVQALHGILRVHAKFAVSQKTRVRKETSVVERGLLAVAAVLGSISLFGIIYWSYSGRPLEELTTNMMGLALFWNTYNFILIVPFLLFLRRHEAKGPPANAVAVPSLPAFLLGRDSTHDVCVTALDLAGATVTTRGGAPSGKLHLLLEVGQRQLHINGEVVQARPCFDGTCEVQLAFGKLTPEQATALTLSLFHDIVPETLRFGPRDATHTIPAPALPTPEYHEAVSRA